MKYTTIGIKVSEELKEEIINYVNDYKKRYNKCDDYTLSKHLRLGIIHLIKQYYKSYPKDWVNLI